MTGGPWIPLLVLLSSLIPGIIIFFLSEEHRRLRTALNLTAAVGKLLLIVFMLWRIYEHREYEVRIPVVSGLDLLLHVDGLSLLFASLSGVLWLLTTIYAIAYLEGSPNRSRFFGFFSLCVTATMGTALAGNLFTFLIFYEMLTLATYPLVVHRGTPESLRAGRVYLTYTLGGGALLFVAVVWLHVLVGPFSFGEGIAPAALTMQDRGVFVTIFALLIAGLGVKAALVPLHGWLPVAMIAPAPVSALLHAVAVVKAGAFGIVRVVYDVFGIPFSQDLGVAGPLVAIASVTIVYGSIRALFQDDLKRRLAYSTVSQVSYIILGVAMAGPSAMIGGIVHLVHQGLMKITLFFCAGNVAETLHIHQISRMNGVGQRMPWTMAAFTVGAFGMIGVPPTAGFISKWYLGLGALEAGHTWVIVVLAASTLLNAAYFLPILYVSWFRSPGEPWPENHRLGPTETHWALLLPPVVTALLTLVVGLFASHWVSPLHWATLIADRVYWPWSRIETTDYYKPILIGGTAWALVLVITLPVLVALLLWWRRSRPLALALVPWAAVPALALSFWVPIGTKVEVPGLLLGMRLGLDATGQVFLFFSAVLWIVASLYARCDLAEDEARPRFFAFFLLTMSGNLGLILALDMASFYLFFALLSFAAYGLVVHRGDTEARWAGRVYMVLVVVGEVLLFLGLILAARAVPSLSFENVTTGLASSPRQGLVVALLLAGFGIKAGALPLHVWLPLAHPAAPTPASAILSGALIKAGLLGWLRFLPLGVVELPGWGGLCLLAGLAAAFFGVLVGVTQTNPKSVLAYSSISQMGLMTVGIGAGLVAPGSWPLLLTAVLIYAVHHGLAKGALFLGVGLAAKVRTGGWPGRLVGVGLLVPALALAGAPLTSGTIAKVSLKEAIETIQAPWSNWLEVLLALAAAGTTLLMVRFLFLAGPRTGGDAAPPPIGLWLPWLLLLACTALAVWLLPWEGLRTSFWVMITPKSLRDSLWPIVVGATFAWLAWRWILPDRLFGCLHIPPGDVLVAVTRLWDGLRPALGSMLRPPHMGWLSDPIDHGRRFWNDLGVPTNLTRMESGLTRWTVVGQSILILMAILFLWLRLR